jgi:hypothetical protein
MGQRTFVNSHEPNNLALTLRHQSKFQEAEQLFIDALTECTKLCGSGHLLTLRIRNNHATTLGLQSRPEAEQALREALDASTQSLGILHLDTLASNESLARLLEHQERYHEAEIMLREVLAAWKTLENTDHPKSRVQLLDCVLY